MIIKDFETEAQAVRYLNKNNHKWNDRLQVITMGGTWYVETTN
jgi:hypothetical protein